METCTSGLFDARESDVFYCSWITKKKKKTKKTYDFRYKVRNTMQVQAFKN